MNIVYSTDNNYARHCGASLASLLDNNIEVETIDILIISDRLQEENIENLKEIAKKYQRNINFIEIDDLCDSFKNNHNFPFAAFGRLFLENLEEYDKILYIDCDTIINGSLTELWNEDIDDYYLAGVQDSIQPYALEILGMDKNDRYLNSGVLLINLKKWRQEKLKHKFLKYIDEYEGNVPHNDQGVLNGVCKGKILFISPKYNMMPELLTMTSNQLKMLYSMKNYYSQEDIKNANNDIKIIHYLAKFYNRPWFTTCTHPFKDKYIYYLNTTSFEKELMEGNLKGKILLQKNIYNSMPFGVFWIFEKVLDIRRKIKCYIRHRKRKKVTNAN